MRGCRSLQAIVPGPDWGEDRFEWFSRGLKFGDYAEKNPHNLTQDGFLFSRAYEWRLNMETGKVKERNLSGTDFSMDFPNINEKYTGLKHKYGFTQVIDFSASSMAGIKKFIKIFPMALKHCHIIFITGVSLYISPSKVWWPGKATP